MPFKPKILVVDDDPKALKFLDDALTRMGAEPHCMSSGLLATDLIHRDRFDGILVDSEMPEVNGLNLAQRVRKSKANAKCPIILMSGDGPGTTQDPFHADVNFFLDKPVDPSQLHHLLSAISGLMLEEHRQYQRARVTTSVLCRWKQPIRGQMLNLSAGGMLASIGGSVPVKANVRLSFKLPGGDESFDLRPEFHGLAPTGRSASAFWVSARNCKSDWLDLPPVLNPPPRARNGCAVDSCLPAVHLQEKDLSRNLMKSCSHRAQSNPIPTSMLSSAWLTGGCRCSTRN